MTTPLDDEEKIAEKAANTKDALSNITIEQRKYIGDEVVAQLLHWRTVKKTLRNLRHKLQAARGEILYATERWQRAVEYERAAWDKQRELEARIGQMHAEMIALKSEVVFWKEKATRLRGY